MEGFIFIYKWTNTGFEIETVPRVISNVGYIAHSNTKNKSSFGIYKLPLFYILYENEPD